MSFPTIPEISWTSLIFSSAPFIFFLLILLVKTLIDFRIAPYLVRILHRVPVRGAFRLKVADLRGTWLQRWATTSTKFTDSDRESSAEMYQFGPYCYTETCSQGITYGVFGRVKGKYFYGDWYDMTDDEGYFGTFELQIIDSKNLDGIFIGHSTKHAVVQHGAWTWIKQELENQNGRQDVAEKSTVTKSETAPITNSDLAN